MADTLKVDPPAGDGEAENDDNPEARVGSMIAGHYSLLRLLGTGGMGAVYEAENSWTGRHVAIKVMLPRAAKIATASERFLREARAASKVQHANIVEVLDAGQNPSDNALYIVQELLRGTDLRALLRERTRLPWTEAMSILGPVMDALAAAHRQGVVHRDVKPENVYLADTPSGRSPKLIDFGIARLTDADNTLNLTHSGALMGTPYYMAPEQARGQRDVDARADVWAMGVVLREVLTGARPFAGSNYNALMMSILHDRVPATGEVTADVPPHAAAAIDRALSRDVEQRFRDMGEFLEALRSTIPDALAQTAPGMTVSRSKGGASARAALLAAASGVFVVGALFAASHARASRGHPITGDAASVAAVVSASPPRVEAPPRPVTVLEVPAELPAPPQPAVAPRPPRAPTPTKTRVVRRVPRAPAPPPQVVGTRPLIRGDIRQQ